MRAFHNDDVVLPLPGGHRFPIGKYRLLSEAARSLAGLRLSAAPAASDGELALAHTPAWTAAVFEGRLSAAAQREIG
ncbi:MAG: histone deacetylase, partial [Alphaproteobacteria bacterium]|nr:histone deacetylase [Alphaproteobacteria bacterium]